MKRNIKTVHYLGSKIRMLPEIKKCIDELNHTGGRVCDLFSGSGVVSEFLLQQYDILAVDIQKYSSVYCKARLTGGIQEIDSKKLELEIKESISRKTLLDKFKPILEYESKGMEKLSYGHIETIYEIIEKGSLYAYLGNYDYADGILSCALRKVFSDVKNMLGEKINSVDSTITRYYGGLYFSFR